MPLRRRRTPESPALPPYQRAQIQLHVPLKGATLADLLGVTPAALDKALVTTRSSDLTQRLAILAELARLLRQRLGNRAEAWRVELLRPRHAFDERSAAEIMRSGSLMDMRSVLRDVAGISPRPR